MPSHCKNNDILIVITAFDDNVATKILHQKFLDVKCVNGYPIDSVLLGIKVIRNSRFVTEVQKIDVIAKKCVVNLLPYCKSKYNQICIPMINVI